MDKHSQRIDIFNSTLELIQQGWYMASDGSRVELPSAGEVMAAAKFYSERFGGVYSGIVTFFRGPEDEGSMLDARPYNVPVISVAALAGPRIGDDGMMLPPEVDITLDKMRTILRTGLRHNPDGNYLPFLREYA